MQKKRKNATHVSAPDHAVMTLSPYKVSDAYLYLNNKDSDANLKVEVNLLRDDLKT